MTIVAQAEDDKRNLEWRKDNVGSALLAKMGWKEGQGIGKRSKDRNTQALKVLKRREQLGLGAKMQSQGGEQQSVATFSAVLANLHAQHKGEDITGEDAEDDVGDGDDDDDRSATSGERKAQKKAKKKAAKKAAKKAKKKAEKEAKKKAKKDKPSLTLARNRVSAGHARKMRDAKFGPKSEHDMACIFGTTATSR